MTMNEAKEFLENSKNVKVTYGVPFEDWYVFGFSGKDKKMPMIGGLYMVNKDSNEISIFNPLDHDVDRYEECFAANVMYYSKDAFSMPLPVHNV